MYKFSTNYDECQLINRLMSSRVDKNPFYTRADTHASSTCASFIFVRRLFVYFEKIKLPQQRKIIFYNIIMLACHPHKFEFVI